MQYARSKVDYAIGEFIYMLSSDMNVRIGKVRNYNNKILISSPSFKIGTNVKVNIDGEQVKLKDKPDVKSKEVEMVKTKPNVKLLGRKGCFDIGDYSCLYSMVDVQMTSTFS